MLPKAYLKAKVSKRARLYVPEKRKAKGYFSRLNP